MFVLTGFRQSFSGSETSTDMSFSSSENLDCCSLRQEPQGAETHRLFQNTFDPIVNGSDTYSILSRLGMPQSALELKGTDPSTFYVTGSATPTLVVDGHSERETQCYSLHQMAVDSSGTQTHAVGAHPVKNQQMSVGQHQENGAADDRGYSLLPLPNQPKEKSDDANLLLRWHQQQQQCRSPSGRSSRSPVPQPTKQTQPNAFVEPSAQSNLGSDTRIEEWGAHVMKGTATSMPANENWHQLDAAMSASTRHMTLPTTLPTTLPNALVSNSATIKNVLTNVTEQPRPATAPITGRHAKLLNVPQPDHHGNDSNVLTRGGKFRRSYERFECDRTVRTHSQPDLTHLAMMQLAAPSDTMQLQRNQQIAGSIESADSLSFDELSAITNG